MRALETVPPVAWDRLKESRIFFGHHSVGRDILLGVSEVSGERLSFKPNVVETTDPERFDFPIFAHGRVGQNEDPISKIRGFESIMKEGIGDKVGFAFYKFCYVDIRTETDVDSLFELYKESMDRLEAKYPRVGFIHWTVPLRASPLGLRDRAREAFKAATGARTTFKDNLTRNRFNALMTEHYGGERNFFDLADAECASPNGSRSCSVVRGEQVFSLAPHYSRDGGHLNEKGRRWVAENLIARLAFLVTP